MRIFVRRWLYRDRIVRAICSRHDVDLVWRGILDVHQWGRVLSFRPKKLTDLLLITELVIRVGVFVRVFCGV